MGSSTVMWRGGGFWVRDGALEVWLHLLAQRVRADPDTPDWLRRAGEHWHEHAHVGFIGCVDAGLDEYVGEDAERAARVLALCREVCEQVARDWAPAVPADVLNSFGLPGTFERDVDVAVFAQVGHAFCGLLAGDPDYAVVDNGVVLPRV